MGPISFVSTLNELKTFLKFIPISDNQNNYDAILFHNDILKDKIQKDLINNSKSIKICVDNKKNLVSEFDAYLELPASIKEINSIVENVFAKKKFNKNSSMKIKDYFLNKNEKKLSKQDNFVILTEKEIQLLELFLVNQKPISKDIILSSVWNYSAEADTHTVETHIYRLRKKISEKFMDEEFILNNKEGYYL